MNKSSLSILHNNGNTGKPVGSINSDGDAVAPEKHPFQDMNQAEVPPPYPNYVEGQPLPLTGGLQLKPELNIPSPQDGKMPDQYMLEDHISFLRTISAFQHYKKQAMGVRDMRYKNFLTLQNKHRDLLCVQLDTMFERYSQCIQANSTFLDAICNSGEELFRSYWPEGTTVRMEDVPPPTSLDMDKVFSTLRQFVRDWAGEGAPERDCVYSPILDALERCFPNRQQRLSKRILIPGAGLCRLSVELALRGFFAQANEFSYHMLIAGDYIQNHVTEACQHKIFPYSDTTCNLVNRADQFVEVLVPDLCAYEAIDELQNKGLDFGELSMVAGEFTEVYSKPNQHKTWSAVVTCFFIDTAHNIIEYLEIIYNLLVPGGYWVNVGPLLYHFADSVEDMSIELSLGEVLTVAQRIGFVLLSSPTFIDTTYTNNQRSMKQLVYRCAFFLLQRPLTDERRELGNDSVWNPPA
ncbi:unnamed protein product [Phytomonas sp. EM1]|nr:unnamed protein product [Phytomonas sp. EM1]|eukprot:CCW60558.1 unnamed protein product [Phytomonas sp. isolate EM1]